MTGRKQPREREEDRDHEYRMQQKRSLGEDTGDMPEIREAGSEVAREREEYAEHKERLSRQDF